MIHRRRMEASATCEAVSGPKVRSNLVAHAVLCHSRVLAAAVCRWSGHDWVVQLRSLAFEMVGAGVRIDLDSYNDLVC